MSEEKRVEWTDDRIEQFNDLENLLITVRGLNNGSNFLSKLEQCIATAKVLTSPEIGRRLSFLAFLRSDIIAERATRLKKENK